MCVFLCLFFFFLFVLLREKEDLELEGWGRPGRKNSGQNILYELPLSLTHGHLMLRKFTKNYVLALGLRMTCAYKVFLGHR